MSKRRSTIKSALHNEFLFEHQIVSQVTEAKTKKFSHHDLKSVKPLTSNQTKVFAEWNNGSNLFMSGVYGTGKTFIGMYLALNEVLDPSTPYDKLIIIKSIVASREIGFLKGSEEEKVMPYTIPYINVCEELFNRTNQYKHMEEAGILEFHPSSFVRGNTFNNAIILIDEIQNFNYTEGISCLGRVGKNSRVIVMGDGKYQNDLQYKKSDKSGFDSLYKISTMMPSFRNIEFGVDDIVRSGFCKELAEAMIKFEEM